jgi:hypothetical protein
VTSRASRGHFDRGYEQKVNGGGWQINPCNHDGGFLIPAPGALLCDAQGDSSPCCGPPML